MSILFLTDACGGYECMYVLFQKQGSFGIKTNYIANQPEKKSKLELQHTK